MVLLIAQSRKGEGGTLQTAGIDWLRLSVPYDMHPSIWKMCVAGTGETVKTIKPAYHRKDGRMYENGVRIYSDIIRRRNHIIDIDGSSLTTLMHDGFRMSTYLDAVLSHGATITRIDLCHDYYDKGVLAIVEGEAWRHNKRKEKNREVTVRQRPDAPLEGVTIYEGGNYSDHQCKLYDKNIATAGLMPTSRFEVKTQYKAAKAIGRLIAGSNISEDRSAIADKLLGVLRNEEQVSALTCDLVELDAFWYTRDVKAIDVQVSKVAGDTEQWLMRSVLPCLIANMNDIGGEHGSYYELVRRACENHLAKLTNEDVDSD